MAIKYDGQGQLITVSFYLKELDHPYDAGVTIRRVRAGKRGCGSRVDEKWLPVDRSDALVLLKHLGSVVNAVWAEGDRFAVVLP
jgi:hypothetical protein